MKKKIYKKWLERLERKSDTDYLAKEIFKYCIERGIVGLSTPWGVDGYIVKFSIQNQKKEDKKKEQEKEK